MKKFGLLLVLCAVFIVIAGSVCFAAGVSESPNISIVIDGKIGTYTDVPIISGGRTLLPLRQVLANLGVQNDDEHIIWNSKEKSITVNKDSTKIILTVGKNEATVNETAVKLDVPPLIYKNRTYIPARFVAQSLGKNVAWDDKTKAVLIREEKQYNEIKDIMEAVNKAMESFNNCKLGTEGTMVVNGVKYTVTGTSEVDIKKDITHSIQIIKSEVQDDVKQEIYASGKTMYTKIPNMEKWLKTQMTDEQVKENSVGLENSEILCSCLFVATDSNEDEIKLAGDVNLPGYFVEDNGAAKLKSKTYSTEIYIDKKTNIVKKVVFDVSGNYTVLGKIVPFSTKVTMTYTDFDGDFEVKLPDNIDSNSITQ